ncbi:uncharacterized protein LOC111075485 [Drosophila obscura]|uniref:uncharacterized protein LOC111075485 n=1 Tax=Drosophila obscura TaxID=7282 RepID=UPI001BB1D572|nr:uncharacterized protein LOC111075485 [Drosophila obscura]
MLICSCHKQLNQRISNNMGNVMDRKVSPTPSPIEAKAKEEEQVAEQKQEAPKLDTNLPLQLFCYRQQLPGKSHHIMKWATAKLLLTEELLKLQQTHPKAPCCPWENYEATMIADDGDGDQENRAPNNDDLSRELTTLKSYRMELRETILKVAHKKKTKTSQKKLKRLNRRTLISSKKPSSKEKRKPQYNEWLLSEDEPECPLQADYLQAPSQVDVDPQLVDPVQQPRSLHLGVQPEVITID